MTCPSLCLISSSTALSRSSNWPRYCAPATMRGEVERDDALAAQRLGDVALDDAARETLDDGGLPDTGSPIRTGLFFVRRLSTWMTRRISLSRPMTGSSSPRRARSVRSTPYFSSAL